MKNIANDKLKNKVATASSLELDISLIDEDPDQPRTEFDPVTLQELADTIRLRGVKTPISVHPNPGVAGRFIINHGARRFRASILASKKTIPAFIDTDYSKVDQVIENLQRDALTPREIADFIGSQYSKGLNNTKISKLIGKSPAFVSQHHILLNLPSTIEELYSSGRVRDVLIIYNLVSAFKESPEITIEWVNNSEQAITRSSVNLLRQFIKIENNKAARPTINKSNLVITTPTPTPTRRNKVKVNEHQYEYNCSSKELLSLLNELQEQIVSQKKITVKSLDSLTKEERINLSSTLNKIINFAKN